MGKPDAPTPPDPMETARAQTNSNVSTAVANARLGNVNQRTPYGDLTYNEIGSSTMTGPNGEVYQIPRFEAVQTVSPAQQGIMNASNQASQNAADAAVAVTGNLNRHLRNNPLSFDGLPQGGSAANIGTADYGTVGTDFSADRQRVEDALMSRLNPSLERDRESLRTSLINQGVNEGSEAFDRAMNRFGEQSNDARMSAILGAAQEQSRLADLERANIGFNNNVAQMGLMDDYRLAGRMDTDRGIARDELLALRNQPINEMGALMSGGQVTQPQFMSTRAGNIPTTDVAAIIGNNYNQQLGQWQQNQEALGSGLSGIGGLFQGLGAAGLTLSDERAKTDKKKIGETDDGIGIYSYRYKGSPKTEIGLMAQEVQKKKPQAVARTGAGLLAVDYGAALEV